VAVGIRTCQSDGEYATWKLHNLNYFLASVVSVVEIYIISFNGQMKKEKYQVLSMNISQS
jgi:hypothetical protein